MATIKSDKFVDINILKSVVNDEDILFPIMENLRMPVQGIKFYGDAFLKIMSLERCSISFYLWALMSMTKNMIVSTDSYSRNCFIDFARYRGTDYKDVTVYKAIKDIIGSGLFVDMKRGRCKANPRYCFRGTDAERKRQVRLVNHNTNKDNIYVLEFTSDKELKKTKTK